MNLAALLLPAILQAPPGPPQGAEPAIPSLRARVTRLRFFEGGPTLPGVLERRYETRFDSVSTRGVYVEIGLAYPPAAAAASLTIECGFTSPGGGAAGTATVPVQADPGWELSVHAGGVVPPAPGGWASGTYAVVCRHRGNIIASSSFEIFRPAAAPAPAAPGTGRRPPRPGVPPATPANDPNRKIPAVLSGTAVGAIKAKVTGVRLFESGGDLPDRKDRVITTTFDALTTRFINIELEVEYPRAPRAAELEIPCRIEGPDSTERIPVIRVAVDPGWVGSYHTAGWGARNRGMWPEGSYRLTCRSEGKTLATADFAVIKARAAVEALGASLTHLRFYQSPAERLPGETRRYGSRFDGRSARWIRTEFGLVYPQVSSPVSFPVECTYTFPDGTTRLSRVERTIPAGWTGSVHTQGVGSDRPGTWPSGLYRVACASGGRAFAEGGFEVFDADASPSAGATLRFFTRRGTAETSGVSFGVTDTVFLEAGLPARLSGDSTALRCTLRDPAGSVSGFSIEGEVRDRVLRGAAPLPVADAPRARGDYRVECRAGARAVAAAGMTLVGAPDLPPLDARVVTAGVYEGGERAPDDEAVPDVAFAAPRVRSLWVVALLDHPSDRGVGTMPYACTLTGPRNVKIADSGTQASVFAPGDRMIVVRQRLLPLPRQRWTAGRHTLACSSGGIVFFRSPIEITR